MAKKKEEKKAVAKDVEVKEVKEITALSPSKTVIK